MSVSNLVRHVLTHTVDLVEGVIVDSARVAVSAQELVSKEPASSRPGASAPGDAQPAPIIGWQEIILNRNALCGQCNAILPKGSRGAIAVIEGTGPRETRCLTCLEALSGGHAVSETDA